MNKAAASLRSWVQGTEPSDPLLAVDCLAQCLQGRVQPVQPLVALPPALGLAPLGLEPEPSTVRLMPSRDATDPCDRASDEAKFVYGLAADLVRDQGQTWPVAIAVARQCWQRFQAASPVVLAGVRQQLASTSDADLHEDEADEPLTLDAVAPLRG